MFEAGWLDQGQINWDGEETEQKTSAWAVLEKYFTDTPIKAGGRDVSSHVSRKDGHKSVNGIFGYRLSLSQRAGQDGIGAARSELE